MQLKGFIAIAALAALLGVGAAAAKEERKISPSFSALDFNDVTSNYLEVPTFVTLSDLNKGDSEFRVEFDKYGVNEYGLDYEMVRFRKSAIPEYRAHIAKFLEWEAIASEDGDILDKEIGTAAGIRGKLKFLFHSGSAQRHFLVIRFCTIGVCTDSDLVLDRQGAEGLGADLAAFAERGVAPVKIDDKYR